MFTNETLDRLLLLFHFTKVFVEELLQVGPVQKNLILHC